MTVVSRPRAAIPIARRVMLTALILVSCWGCATRPDAHPRDPLEPFNRGVFTFNDAFDRAVFKPAAIVYRDLTPALVRTGVGNFLGNLDDAWSFVNSVLQLKGQAAAESFMRFSVNSVMGLGGILDVASALRIERHSEDFGQTLGRWGVSTGPYVVLPIFGPSTLRDAVALPVDMTGDLVSYISPVSARNSLRVLNVLDLRVGLLSVTTALDEVALDKYTFTRDAFLQRRRNLVFDGDPPEARTLPDGKPDNR